MKLKVDVHLPSFLQQVRLCTRDVWFVTPEGDKLNLKSVLSEYIFMSAAISTSLVEDGSVVCDASEDAVFLKDYFREG